MQNRGKGQFELAMLMIEVAVLLIGMFLIISLLRTWWQPYRQIAFSNAELLRIAINDVCAGGNAKTLEFDFPQSGTPRVFVPGTGGTVVIGQNLIPKMFIKSSGDPAYLLYYESFPPAEAIKWEAYMDLQSRIVYPITSTGNEIRYAAQFLLSQESALLQRARDVGIGASAVVFPNIILSGGNLSGDIGNWSDEFYKFSGYALLPELEKSLVKYRACGGNALCLKTKEGVYRLELPACEEAGIEHMQLERPFFSNVQLISLISAIFSRDDYEVSDFYLASPCSATLKIEMAKCDCRDRTSLQSDTLAGISYPIWGYDVENDVLKKEKTSMRCMHRALGIADHTEPYTSNKCIKISFESDKDFCASTFYTKVGSELKRDIGIFLGPVSLIVQAFSSEQSDKWPLSMASAIMRPAGWMLTPTKPFAPEFFSGYHAWP